MKMKFIIPCSKDFREGADKLHDRLDGKFVLPDKLAVFLLGAASALIPFAILCKIGGVI